MDSIYLTFHLFSWIAAVPQWMVVIAVFSAILVGVFLGKAYWKQLKTEAEMIELETRRAQSEFDLVSRDVIRTKQNVLADLEERNLKI